MFLRHRDGGIDRSRLRDYDRYQTSRAGKPIRNRKRNKGESLDAAKELAGSAQLQQ